MSAAASYIRVKRYKQTLFLHCDLHLDTVLALKERVESLTGVPVLQQKLLLGKQALDNDATLWDCGIEREDEEIVIVHGTIDAQGQLHFEELQEAVDGPTDSAQSVPLA